MSLERLIARACASRARLLLAGGDPLVLTKARNRLEQAGLKDAAVIGTGTMRPEGHPRLGDVAAVLRQRRPERVRDGIHALDLAADPIRFAAGLAIVEDADVVVGGPGVTPELIADTAAWTHGPPPDGGLVHSASWLCSAEPGLVAFADGAFTGTLDPDAWARLARLVARAHEVVSGEPARVAFLTGPGERGTSGAAEAAVAELALLEPGLSAEVDRSVRFRGRANVLIFPCGASAHLAARTGRAFGGAALLGPLLLGPRGVIATVAEDASDDELVGTAALAVLIAGRQET